MRFSTIATALALAFSVNAAAVNKRAVTAATTTCINDLVAVGNQLTVVMNGVNAYTASQGYLGALTVQSQESTLESKLSTAGSTSGCCVSGVVSDEDAAAVIAEVDPLTAQIEAALQAIINKKSVFDSVALVTPLVKGDINSLNSKTTTVSNCLIAATPSSYTSQAQGYVTRINAAFAAAVAAYA
ncbi:hypothetical protein K501DRAFT_206297 [Backusella circina FSU 941]|nr:hypothetical protein K501DRAFT_319741 [Backusella circina FSU 941]KAI8890410.1 hypothetical protein K501DRAFT_206297 [Backusella circina FSU 941]